MVFDLVLGLLIAPFVLRGFAVLAGAGLVLTLFVSLVVYAHWPEFVGLFGLAVAVLILRASGRANVRYRSVSDRKEPRL